MEETARHESQTGLQNSTMTHVWDRLEGASLAGGYGLQRCLGSDSSGAYFLTTFGPERQPAILRLIPEGSLAAEAQLELWRRTAQLAHPSLVTLFDCGRTSADGDVFLYAVFEHPDDSLAAAAQNGPLNEDEARDILIAVLDALRYIHGEGLVHTSIDAEHIVAVGDSIKLGSDTLQHAGETETTYADDIRELGLLIDKLANGISEPLREMIQQAMENAETQMSAPVMVGDPSLATGPVAAPLRPTVPPATQRPARKQWPGIARWVPLVAVLAIALVAGVFVLAHRSTPAPPSAPPIVAVAPSPVVVTPALPQPPKVAAAAPAPRQPFQTWRVIAYTYAHLNDAEKKVQSINTRFAGFHAEVFTLKHSPVPYLVSLGAHLTRDEAAALQKKAIAKGLPPDTFIRNFAD